MKTEIDNHSKDHRYRLCLNTGLEGKTVRSGSQFYVNERSRQVTVPEKYVEKPMNNQPQRLFTDLFNERAGLSVFSRGFSEYDARENGDLYLTLLRCVSHLSKPTLEERSFTNAGPEYETPLAQEIGLHSFDYCFSFHDGDAPQHEILRSCDEFYAMPRGMQGFHYEGALPASGSFLKLMGEGLMLSAVKQAECGDGWIVRIYNGAEQSVSGSLEFLRPLSAAYHTDLREKEQQPLPFIENKLSVRLHAYEIGTYHIHFVK